MNSFREMSGITFYVASNDTQQQPGSLRGAEMPNRAHRTPFEPLTNAQDSNSSIDGMKAFLPLMDVIVDVNVIGSNSRTVLTQIFSNPTDEVISESRYIFPLYDGSTVINFRFWVGDRSMIEGVVMPKKEAGTYFKNALAEKKIAGLLVEETPEIFEISLGNIPPESVVRVEILYLNELKLDVGGEGLLVTVPTSIAPRYGEALVQEMFMRRQTKLSGKGLRIQVDINAPDPLHVPESRTHPIKYSPASVDDFADLADPTSISSRVDSSKGRVSTAHPFPVLDRDFVLLLKTKDRSILEPRALMEHCETSCNTAALQVSVNPLKLFADAERTDLDETEIIFVIDRSGSMMNEKIEMLKKSLEILLETMLDKYACLFNICSFGSGTHLLWPESTPCTESSLKHVFDFLSTSCESNMGGTELENALRVALDTRSNSKDVKTQFIVMTDGEVWDYNGVMRFVRSTKCKYHDKVRYFALGIGDEVSHQLVEGIAHEGGGFANVIPAGPYGDWKSGIVRILDGAMVSDNWELSLRLSGRLGNETDVEDVPQYVQAPFRILSLHAFTTSRVYFLFKEGKPAFEHVVVEGKSTTGLPIAKTIPVEHLKATPPIIHQLAAKAIMKDLEAVAGEDSEKCSEDLATVNKEARDQAIELGLRWNIIGKHTSFVGVDSATQEETTTRTYKSEYLDLDELKELHRHDPFDSLSFLRKTPELAWRQPSLRSGVIINDDNNDREAVTLDSINETRYPSHKVTLTRNLNGNPGDLPSCHRIHTEEPLPPGFFYNFKINLTEVYHHDIWIQLGFSPSARREDFLIFFLLKAQHQDGWFQLDVGSLAQWKKYLESFFEKDCGMKLSDHLKGGLRRSLERHLHGHPERHGGIVISPGTIQQLQSLKSDIPGRQAILNDLSDFQPNCSPQYVSSILADLEAICSEWEALEGKAMNTVLAVVFIMVKMAMPIEFSPFRHERLNKADLWLSQNLHDEELKEALMNEARRNIVAYGNRARGKRRGKRGGKRGKIGAGKGGKREAGGCVST